MGMNIFNSFMHQEVFFPLDVFKLDIFELGHKKVPSLIKQIYLPLPYEDAPSGVLESLASKISRKIFI